MFTRATLKIYCKCGKELSDQEVYLFDILDGMCQDCYDYLLDSTYELLDTTYEDLELWICVNYVILIKM